MFFLFFLTQGLQQHSANPSAPFMIMNNICWFNVFPRWISCKLGFGQTPVAGSRRAHTRGFWGLWFSNNLKGIVGKNSQKTANSPGAAVLSPSPPPLSFSDNSWRTRNTEDHIRGSLPVHCPPAASSTSYLACSTCWALSFSLLSLSFLCFSSNSLLSCSCFCRSCSTFLACSLLRASSSLWGTVTNVYASYQKKVFPTFQITPNLFILT